MKICPECDSSFADSAQICPNDGTFLISAAGLADSLTGEILDERYKIIRRVATGGMGTVYQAEHLMMQRTVAIKILHRRLVQDDESTEFLLRFQREARLSSKIVHPNAATVYDFGMYVGRPYLVMQYIDGSNLKQLLKREGPFEEKRALALMKQVTDVVGFAHDMGIVHRDLKPANIMLSTDDSGADLVHVLDFGIAKAMREGNPGATALTETGVVMGTPHYMSPEQVYGADADARSDVYSLGAIFYETVVGKTPYEGAKGMNLMLKHVHETLVPPRKRSADCQISSECEAIILRALHRDPEKRFPSCATLNDAITMLEQENNKSDGGEVLKSTQKLPTVQEPKTESGVFGRSIATLGFGVAFFLAGFFLYPAVMLPDAAEARQANVERHIENGARLLRAKQLPQAFENFELALDLDTKNALAHFYLGELHSQLNRFEQAADAYERAVTTDPSFVKARMRLSQTFIRLGERKKAIAELREVLRHSPDNLEARSDLRLLTGRVERRRRFR